MAMEVSADGAMPPSVVFACCCSPVWPATICPWYGWYGLVFVSVSVAALPSMLSAYGCAYSGTVTLVTVWLVGCCCCWPPPPES